MNSPVFWEKLWIVKSLKIIILHSKI
jgi:hypothetical protein